jgi:hypothetical protein
MCCNREGCMFATVDPWQKNHYVSICSSFPFVSCGPVVGVFFKYIFRRDGKDFRVRADFLLKIQISTCRGLVVLKSTL